MSDDNALSALGLDETEESAYRALLVKSSTGVRELAAQFQLPSDTVSRVLDSLMSHGLVKMVSDGSYAACPPETAVLSLLADQVQQVRRGYEALSDMERVYRAFQARLGEGTSTETVIGRTAITSRLSQLQERASEEICVFVRPPLLTTKEEPEQRAASARGVRYRGLYEKTILDNIDAMEVIKNATDAVGQIRFAANLPLKMMLIDKSVALIMEPDIRDSAMVTEHPTLLALISALFEHIWSSSIPAPLGAEFAGDGPTEPGLSDPDDRLLLSLLLSGLTDQAIAARLGVGLRTVQRRVRDLMDAAQVDTRIQLGWQASRRGWVD